GKLFSLVVFEDDKIRSARYFDKNGKQLSLSESRNKKIEMATFRPNGTKRSVAAYNEKGQIIGNESIFYNSGSVSEINEYKDGELNGHSTGYFPNGQKSAEINFEDGKKDGYYTSFFLHGGKQSEGWYKENIAEGTWMFFNEQGVISSSTEYLHDELNGYKTQYYPNGNKESETLFSNGRLQEMVQYDSTGKEFHRLKIK